jgi:hypothetical protein
MQPFISWHSALGYLVVYSSCNRSSFVHNTVSTRGTATLWHILQAWHAISCLLFQWVGSVVVKKKTSYKNKLAYKFRNNIKMSETGFELQVTYHQENNVLWLTFTHTHNYLKQLLLIIHCSSCTTLNPLKHEVHVNSINKFSSYVVEKNASSLQRFHAYRCKGLGLCSFWESYGTRAVGRL